MVNFNECTGFTDANGVLRHLEFRPCFVHDVVSLWRREGNLNIPVRNPDVWENDALREEIVRLRKENAQLKERVSQ